jgi:hypothetical protein
VQDRAEAVSSPERAHRAGRNPAPASAPADLDVLARRAQIKRFERRSRAVGFKSQKVRAATLATRTRSSTSNTDSLINQSGIASSSG